MSQAKRTVRMLRLQAAEMVNGRGTTLSVAGDAYEWMTVSLLGHDQIPDAMVPSARCAGGWRRRVKTAAWNGLSAAGSRSRRSWPVGLRSTGAACRRCIASGVGGRGGREG